MEQCAQTPNAIAVLDHEGNLTYRELHERSNQLAHYLRARGIQPGDCVAIMVKPGPLMLVGMLAIIKAGAAYVALDPMYPTARIQYMLNHSNVEIIMSEDSLKNQVRKILKSTDEVHTVIKLDQGEGQTDFSFPNYVTKDRMVFLSNR